MKKLLLGLIFLALLSTSCSDSVDPLQSAVTARINGVEHVFNTVNVDTQTYAQGDSTYTDVIVTASYNRNPNKRISFIVEQGVLGLESSWYFAYFLEETAYPQMEGFQVAVTENTANRLVGSFAGKVQSDVEPYQVLDIENGSFNIVY